MLPVAKALQAAIEGEEHVFSGAGFAVVKGHVGANLHVQVLVVDPVPALSQLTNDFAFRAGGEQGVIDVVDNRLKLF